jgi:hypothetical protein
VDVLVSPVDRRRALDALERVGFEPAHGNIRAHEGAYHSTTLARPGFGEVDVHETFPGFEEPPDTVWQALAGHRCSAQLGHRPVPSLDAAAMALLAILAAGRDGLNTLAASRLQTMLTQPVPWPAVVQLARATGSTAVTREVLRSHGAADLAAGLDLEGRLSLEWELRLSRAPREHVQAARILSLPPRSAAEALFRELFPSVAMMRLWRPGAETRRDLLRARADRWRRLASLAPSLLGALARYWSWRPHRPAAHNTSRLEH